MSTKRKETSAAEVAFCNAWALATVNDPTLPAFERELVFHPERKWRLDFAWVIGVPNFRSRCIALEIDGRGRHQTVAGARADCEKYNEATRLGWELYRFPATDKAEAAQWVEYMIEVMFYR